MASVQVVVVAAVVLCLAVASVVGHGLAGADEPPSLGTPILVPATTAGTSAASDRRGPVGGRAPGQAPAGPSTTKGPPGTAAPVPPPSAQDAGDDDPEAPDDLDDLDGPDGD